MFCIINAGDVKQMCWGCGLWDWAIQWPGEKTDRLSYPSICTLTTSVWPGMSMSWLKWCQTENNEIYLWETISTLALEGWYSGCCALSTQKNIKNINNHYVQVKRLYEMKPKIDRISASKPHRSYQVRFVAWIGDIAIRTILQKINIIMLRPHPPPPPSFTSQICVAD
jgi:hypothetical protein